MSMISTALTGLMAAQRGLEATSNNVANAGTDGYVRRRIVQAEAVTAGVGIVAALGSGVRVTDVQRLYDSFLTDALRSATSTEQRSQVLADLTTRLDGLLGNPELSIGTSIQAFFDKADLLGRDPTSASNRQQLLMQGESLSQRFQQLNTQLGGMSDEVDRRLEDSVNRINTLAASLARINETLGRGAGSVNDLEDQRDALLAELTSQIDGTVIRQEDGTVSVLVGSGQPLVLGINSARLSLSADQFDPTRMQVNIDLGGQSLPISRQIAGGALGGLLAFRSDSLDTAQRELGLLAASLASAFNLQHAQGADANGNLGGDFFVAPSAPVYPAETNTGTGTVTATIGDAALLRARDYELRFNGTAWSVQDAATRQAVAITAGDGSAANPFLFDGLAVTVPASGTGTNDRFMVRPAAGAAGRVAMAIGDPGAIAAASPVRTGRSLSNLSDATIALAGVADATDPSLQLPVQIQFVTATTFTITDASGTTGPLAYTSDADISFNGWTARISGAASAGDLFTVTPTPPGSGDNANALALSRIPGQGFLDNGQLSVDALAARLVATVGASALRNKQDLEVQSALREQTQTDLEGMSGVNLDEEAANLLRYQQAYQASSKIIAIADELFRSLLSIVQ